MLAIRTGLPSMEQIIDGVRDAVLSWFSLWMASMFLAPLVVLTFIYVLRRSKTDTTLEMLYSMQLMNHGKPVYEVALRARIEQEFPKQPRMWFGGFGSHVTSLNRSGYVIILIPARDNPAGLRALQMTNNGRRRINEPTEDENETPA